jgi:hypothetical protein
VNRCEVIRVELPGLISGELSTQTAITVNVHLRECDACSRELDELRETITILSAAPLQAQVDPGLEQRVFDVAALEQVGSMVSAAPLETEPPIDLEARALVRAGVLDAITTPRSRWAKVTMVLAPSLAATAVVVGFFASQWHSRLNRFEDSFGPMGQHVATQQLTSFDTTNQARAELYDSQHTNFHIVLHPDRLPVTPPGFHYELWLSGTEGSISAGSFRVTGPEDSVFVFTVAVDPREYPHIELSLEPDDGNPAHTGETIMEANVNLP